VAWEVDEEPWLESTGLIDRTWAISRARGAQRDTPRLPDQTGSAVWPGCSGGTPEYKRCQPDDCGAPRSVVRPQAGTMYPLMGGAQRVLQVALSRD